MIGLKWVAIALLIFIVLVLALIGLFSITRDSPVKHVVPPGASNAMVLPAVSDSFFTRSIELYTGTHIEGGNTVEILLNGDETYPRLWRDIASAKETITVQMYFAQPGVVADTMAKYLSERARAGVRVLLLLDAFGAQPLKKEWIDGLRKSGVEVVWLRPLKWYSLHKAAHRSHARVIVVDGQVGYTGGFGLADYWLGDGRHDWQWRETNVRFEGPAVDALQAAFAAVWVEATGELVSGLKFFPPHAIDEANGVKAGLMHTIPTTGSTPAERFLALTIASARKSLYIANSYFVPDKDMREMLKAAVRRGVDVRVVTPNEKSDVKTTWYAGRSYHEDLLAAGVRIYEYHPSMMHAKTLVVDGIWSSIGSMNFDNRSISFNNESNLVVLDTAVGARMNQIFMDDLRYSHEIKLDEFRKRPWKSRVLEWAAEHLWRIL
jgi:cardiolipin synthase